MNINDFITRWQNKGDEKSDTQSFWNELLHDLLEIDNPTLYIDYEKRVELSHVSFIDAYIPSTRIIIEQKSREIDPSKPQPQSDGTTLTPFEQAKRYYDWLPASERGRYIIVSNFREIRIHDMETPKAPPAIIPLEDITPEKLAFLVLKDKPLSQEVKLSIEAGKLVRKLYDSLSERYINPNDDTSQKSLNVFCVRLVFLLYAEDSGLFPKSLFHDYLKPRQLVARDALKKLFTVLHQKRHQRDPYLESDLQAFPYVNGGLFKDNNIELPQLDGEPLRIILEDMSEKFNWSGINPTIFGAIFESTLNPDTRHSGGMHYTTIENIHKVIDPLFLDGLKQELKNCTTPNDLKALRKKLTALTFLDPACGSGNFLTESYLSLCRLEMDIVRQLGEIPLLQVSIKQFYGIEINDFAVAVAKTALWIADIQMTKEINPNAKLENECLPLEDNENIHEDNAVTTDWAKVIAPNKLNYIISNPPFLGYSVRNSTQKGELEALYGKSQATGKIDYVAGWYYKASEFIRGTSIKAAFVSTNSITQGEQVGYVFKPLLQKFDVHIDFAYQPFMWNSEAQEKAQVHCVIICFAHGVRGGKKRIFGAKGVRLADCINFYLVDGPEVFAESRVYPLRAGTPLMRAGNRAADGGYLIINTPEELADFLKHEPKAEKFIRRYMMGYEFINDVPRWCLWLVDATPQELHDMPLVMERIKLCSEDRLKGAADRQKLAKTSWLFRETLNPKRYLAIPKTSSENRFYIPIAWLDESVIPGDGLLIVPDATLYDFGVLTSRVHMGWMRRVSGRLEMSYRYSARVTYNTFAWPSPTPKQRAKIEGTAREILEARERNAGSSFASLYSELTMPPDLRRAHERNDAAVCEAYGWKRDIGEEEIVSRLFELYYAVLEDERRR